MKKLLCRLFGHKLHPYAQGFLMNKTVAELKEHDPSLVLCERCKEILL